jgi:hypothetical protein
MPNAEGWLQAGELGLALLLSAVIGLEREVRPPGFPKSPASGPSSQAMCMRQTSSYQGPSTHWRATLSPRRPRAGLCCRQRELTHGGFGLMVPMMAT